MLVLEFLHDPNFRLKVEVCKSMERVKLKLQFLINIQAILEEINFVVRLMILEAEITAIKRLVYSKNFQNHFNQLNFPKKM